MKKQLPWPEFETGTSLSRRIYASLHHRDPVLFLPRPTNLSYLYERFKFANSKGISIHLSHRNSKQYEKIVGFSKKLAMAR